MTATSKSRTLLVKNIARLVVDTHLPLRLQGSEMANLEVIDNAYLAVDGDRFSGFGKMTDNMPAESGFDQGQHNGDTALVGRRINI